MTPQKSLEPKETKAAPKPRARKMIQEDSALTPIWPSKQETPRDEPPMPNQADPSSADPPYLPEMERILMQYLLSEPSWLSMPKEEDNTENWEIESDTLDPPVQPSAVPFPTIFVPLPPVVTNILDLLDCRDFVADLSNEVPLHMLPTKYNISPADVDKLVDLHRAIILLRHNAQLYFPIHHENEYIGLAFQPDFQADCEQNMSSQELGEKYEQPPDIIALLLKIITNSGVLEPKTKSLRPTTRISVEEFMEQVALEANRPLMLDDVEHRPSSKRVGKSQPPPTSPNPSEPNDDTDDLLFDSLYKIRNRNQIITFSLLFFLLFFS
jgi:hypothetical protein